MNYGGSLSSLLNTVCVVQVNYTVLLQHVDSTKRPIWFVFSGMGSQWPGMGRDLLKIPVCAATIEKCHVILKDKGLDLKHIITTDDASVFDTILHSFVGIAAIQVEI
jgi:fatty acid synthase